MEKNRLNTGISAGLACIALYLFALGNAMVPLVLLAGYLLLFEDAPLIKRTAIRAVGIPLTFYLIYALLGLFTQIPDVFFSPIRNVSLIASSDVWRWIENNIIGNWNWLFSSFIRGLLSVCQTVILLLAVFASFKSKEFKFKPIDALIKKFSPSIAEADVKKSETGE